MSRTGEPLVTRFALIGFGPLGVGEDLARLDAGHAGHPAGGDGLAGGERLPGPTQSRTVAGVH